MLTLDQGKQNLRDACSTRASQNSLGWQVFLCRPVSSCQVLVLNKFITYFIPSRNGEGVIVLLFNHKPKQLMELSEKRLFEANFVFHSGMEKLFFKPHKMRSQSVYVRCSFKSPKFNKRVLHPHPRPCSRWDFIQVHSQMIV